MPGEDRSPPERGESSALDLVVGVLVAHHRDEGIDAGLIDLADASEDARPIASAAAAAISGCPRRLLEDGDDACELLGACSATERAQRSDGDTGAAAGGLEQLTRSFGHGEVRRVEAREGRRRRFAATLSASLRPAPSSTPLQDRVDRAAQRDGGHRRLNVGLDAITVDLFGAALVLRDENELGVPETRLVLDPLEHRVDEDRVELLVDDEDVRRELSEREELVRCARGGFDDEAFTRRARLFGDLASGLLGVNDTLTMRRDCSVTACDRADTRAFFCSALSAAAFLASAKAAP